MPICGISCKMVNKVVNKGENGMSYFISKLKVNLSKPIIAVVAKPTPVTYIGPGTINKVADILKMSNINKALIVTDAFLLKIGMLDTMLEGIKKAGIETAIYDGVKPDPTYTIVDEALGFCKGCDAIVAVGGGSVIDTAKVVAAAYTNKKSPKELEGFFKVKKPLLKFIAIPTTAGTGSETTIAAVISNPEDHTKTTVVDPKLVPMVAILDPMLTVGLPMPTTVFTTMDALTHALEAYVSNYATPQTDEFAEIAIKTIYESLGIVYKNPQDVQARENLLVASFFAGMAFSRAYIGYVHAFAHSIGGKFGVPHGLANAVILPHVMEYYKPACQERFAKLCDLVKLSSPGDTQEEKCEKFVNSIFEMNRTMQVPERLDKFVTSEVPNVVRAGFKECHGTYPVPRYLSKSDAEKILYKVCKE